MEGILDAIGHDCMSGVCTAVEPRADIVIFGQDVHQFSFALVSPLRAKNHSKIGIGTGFATIASGFDQRCLEAHFQVFYFLFTILSKDIDF